MDRYDNFNSELLIKPHLGHFCHILFITSHLVAHSVHYNLSNLQDHSVRSRSPIPSIAQSGGKLHDQLSSIMKIVNDRRSWKSMITIFAEVYDLKPTIITERIRSWLKEYDLHWKNTIICWKNTIVRVYCLTNMIFGDLIKSQDRNLNSEDRTFADRKLLVERWLTFIFRILYFLLWSYT